LLILFLTCSHFYENRLRTDQEQLKKNLKLPAWQRQKAGKEEYHDIRLLFLFRASLGIFVKKMRKYNEF